MKYTMTTRQLAERLGLTPGRIRHRVKELEDAGVARKIGVQWLFDEDAVKIWKKKGA